MQDLLSFTGLVAIGAALAVPLIYELKTLLGMTHKQFRPILREESPNGVILSLLSGREGSSGNQQSVHSQGGKAW